MIRHSPGGFILFSFTVRVWIQSSLHQPGWWPTERPEASGRMRVPGLSRKPAIFIISLHITSLPSSSTCMLIIRDSQTYIEGTKQKWNTGPHSLRMRNERHFVSYLSGEYNEQLSLYSELLFIHFTSSQNYQGALYPLQTFSIKIIPFFLFSNIQEVWY